MCTGKGDHGAVVETHAAEDGADVASVLAGVGKTAIGCAEGDVAVGAASAVWDLGALHFLDGADTGEDPQIRVGDPWEGLLDGLEEIAGGLETSVGAVVTFGGEAHGSAVGTTSSRHLVVAVVCQFMCLIDMRAEYSRSRGVPCKAKKNGTVATIIVVVVLLKPLGDVVVDLLVVLKPGCEDLPAVGLAEQLWLVCVEAVYTSTDKESASAPG